MFETRGRSSSSPSSAAGATLHQLPPRISIKHRPKPVVEYNDFDDPIGPTYSPTRVPSPSSPKMFNDPYTKKSNTKTYVSILALILFITACAYASYQYTLPTVPPSKKSKNSGKVNPPSDAPQHLPTIEPLPDRPYRKLYTYKDEYIERIPGGGNRRREQSDIMDHNLDPALFWISGLFEEKILKRKSTCQITLPTRDTLLLQKGKSVVEFDPRAAKDPTLRCTQPMNRMWVHEKDQDHAFVTVRCANNAVYKSGNDSSPVNHARLFKEKRILVSEKQKNGIPLDMHHEVLQFDCTENDHEHFKEVRVRVGTNQTLLEECRKVHQDKEHPLNILHIVIEGASRASFMREMRNLVKKLENIEFGHKHRVFQFFRHATVEKLITKSKKRVSLSHPQRIWEMAKKRGHATMYATSHCPYVRTANKKIVKTRAYQHTKHVDHNLATLFCNMKDDTCLAGRNRHFYMFEYARDFMNKYSGVGRTGLLHFFQHEMGTGLDGLLTQFVDQMVTAHPHTVIILSGGGHGQLSGDYYHGSVLGQMEAKLPLLIMAVPEFVKGKYTKAWENMFANQQVITSPRDMIRTMETILEYPEVNHERKSLLTHEFAKERTCNEAGVSDRWCPCDFKPYGTSGVYDGTVYGKEAAQDISKRLANYDICEPVEYDSVKVYGSSDEVIAWISRAGHVYETVLKTRRSRLVSTPQQDEIKARNGETALCDKSVIKRKQDRDLCVCKELQRM